METQIVFLIEAPKVVYSLDTAEQAEDVIKAPGAASV
jgi:hypothetical protein